MASASRAPIYAIVGVVQVPLQVAHLLVEMLEEVTQPPNPPVHVRVVTRMCRLPIPARKRGARRAVAWRATRRFLRSGLSPSVDGDGQRVVDRIVDHRDRRSAGHATRHNRVHWLGFSDSADTRESQEALEHGVLAVVRDCKATLDETTRGSHRFWSEREMARWYCATMSRRASSSGVVATSSSQSRRIGRFVFCGLHHAHDSSASTRHTRLSSQRAWWMGSRRRPSESVGSRAVRCRFACLRGSSDERTRSTTRAEHSRRGPSASRDPHGTE